MLLHAYLTTLSGLYNYENDFKTAIIFLITLSSIAVCAQRTVFLRQAETIKQAYRNSPVPVAAGLDDGEDITYIQDVNNELNQFVGV